MVVEATTTGVALVLAAVLVVAGVIKLVEPRYVAAAMRRISDGVARRAARRGAEARRAGRVVGGVETIAGLALVIVTGDASVAVAAFATLVFAAFVVVVIAAIRRGASCGCWASLSEGPAGGAELGRALALVAGGVVVVVGRAMGDRQATWRPATALAVVAALVALVALTWLGRLLLPVRDANVVERLAVRAAPTRAGRLGAYVAFLFGFVHAGTPAGQRRHLEYLSERLRRRGQAADSADSTPFHRSGSLR